MDRTAYPVVVIGAGPVGLAAAAHLLERNRAAGARAWRRRRSQHPRLGARPSLLAVALRD